ncbi:sugar-binding protein [Pleomorphomonas oryzae]|uniref:sugar-binding protein n=1 Tax=Pleomorphomonas oryzae TaxID=261934 RepID=UPI0004223B28|nr:sugar-binding protein [Pleomorphomonas oryzae]
MKKLLLSTAAVLAVSLSFAGAANAAGKTFAMVPKLIGHPFYAEVEKGCEDAAKKLGVECLFTGSPQADEAEQARVIRDLITKGVDGLAIAPNNAASIAPVIAAAKAKGIPVITFDSDAPKSERALFVGTNNVQGGAEGGKAFVGALPEGGKYAIITGGLAAANLNDRIAGFKSALTPAFTEVSGSPFPCDDDSNRAIQIIQDLLVKNPDLKGIFISGGWPMYAYEAFSRALASRHDDIKAGKLVIVSYDTVTSQLKLLKDGYATALIGQRPYAMGTESMDILKKLSEKAAVPVVVDTGVDLVTSANVDTFLK